MFESTNWMAVIVAAISSMAIGFVWYHPKVFGTAWMKGAGLTPEDGKKANMGMIFGLAFVMAIVVAAFLSTWVHEDENLPEFFHGAFHGFMLSIFVAIPWGVTHALYENRGWKYILINALYIAVAMVTMAGILFIWPGAPAPEH
jgi:predicted permease